MKKHFKVLGITISGALLLGALIGVNTKRIYRAGDYVPEEDAYFVEKIDDPAGLVKAHKLVTPTDDKYNDQKTRSLGSNLIGDIESVWSSYTGKGTTIAIIDDGFDTCHPEYKRADGTSAILSTSRYYYENNYSAYYKEYSSDPSCIAEDWEEDEEYGDAWATHGTNTSTTAAAPMNNGGGVGIAPEADILALKIDFSFSAIKAAINYAVAQKVDVINMSLGAYAESFTDGWGDKQSGSSSTATYLNSACQSAYDAGIIVVAAAGNEATWHKSYPACNTKVVAVGAIGDYDNKGNATQLAEFTNYVGSSQTGEINVDILAPGYVYTATQSGTSSSSHTHNYEDTQGTSFSCPIVAGAACLWKQKYPNGTPDEFLSKLQSSADGIGTYKNKMIPVSGWYSSLDDVGPSNIENGRLNVANLLDISDPYVTTKQSSLNISVTEKKQIELDTHNGTISYKSNNENVATVSSTGLVTGVAAGTTSVTVTATKDSKTATATVNVTVAAAVATTSATFSPDSVTLNVGDTYNSEQTIVVTPSNASRIFLFESNDESVATVNEDTGLVTAIGAGTTTIQMISGYGTGEDELTVTVQAASLKTGTINFGSGTGRLNVNSASVTGTDDAKNSWTVTTSGTSNFTPNASYSQIGSSKSPASSIEFQMTLSKSTKISDVSASLGGFTGTAGTVKISVGSTEIGSGSLSETSDVTVNSSSSATGTTLTVEVTNISKGVKVYNISYKYVGSGSTPTVSAVSVNPTTLNLDLYGTNTGSLSATVTGTGSPAQTVTWSSANTSIATVSSAGVVTGVAVGTTTITATSTVDTTKTGTCSVTVVDTTPVTLSSITISGQKTSFKVNDSFSFGGTVTAHYTDSSKKDVTSSSTFSGYNMSTEGSQTITVSYTEGITKTTTYTITVTDDSKVSGNYTLVWGTGTDSDKPYTYFNQTSGTITNIVSFTTAKNSSTNDPYCSGSLLRLYYNSSGNGGSITLTPATNITITGFVMTTNTEPSVKYAVDGGTATSVTRSGSTYSVSSISATSSLMIKNVNTSNVKLDITKIKISYTKPDESDKCISSISASYSGGNVYTGGTLDTTKVSVTANYTLPAKYTAKTLSSSEYSLTGFSSDTAGNKTVTVTYTGSETTSTSPLTTTFTVKVIEDNVTSVSVTNSKVYHPGETIVKSDITVTLTYSSGKIETTTNFTFANDNYQFTYDDTSSGGTATSKQFSITYASTAYSFNVNVSRTAYVVPVGESGYIGDYEFYNSDISGSSSSRSTGVFEIGNYSFNVVNAYDYQYSNIDYLSFGKNTGSISNAEAFNKDLSSISVTVKNGSRTDHVIYVSKNGTNWEILTDTILSTDSYRFFKVAYETASNNYSNIAQIDFVFSAADQPTNVANYIMFEDTLNQCQTKLNLAITKLNTMTTNNKTIFWTSNDYVIATARERLVAWARHEGKELNLTNGSFITESRTNISVLNALTENSSSIVIVIISFISCISLTGLVVMKKRRNN